MTNIQIAALSIIFGVVGGVIGTIMFLFPYLKKKGIDVTSVLLDVRKVVDTSDKIIDTVNEVLPGNPAVGALQVIEKWAQIAVGDAEELYHTGDICKADREKVAKSVVLSVIKELNIEIDENKRQLIDAAIKNAVNDLGHSSKSTS